MSDEAPTIHLSSEGGIAADHPPLPSPEARVATSGAEEKTHNTIKFALIPFACWRASDVRFDFASSFIRPEIAKELGALKKLIDKHSLAAAPNEASRLRPPLTVFGHADPTGDD